MLKTMLKWGAYRMVPRWAGAWDERRWLQKKAVELLHRAADCQTPQEYYQALKATKCFVPWQNDSEILGLMQAVADLRPRYACEIGAMEGGTLFLWTRVCDPAARLVSLDWELTPGRRQAFPRFARPEQRLTLVEADSHAPATKSHVEELLGGHPLDFLFIDGDHSYAGVRADFEMYAPLVRPGGLIAFHDIVPDYRARYGRPTCRDSGGVPQFWREIRDGYADCREFIDHPDQDGCGIGIVRQPEAST